MDEGECPDGRDEHVGRACSSVLVVRERVLAGSEAVTVGLTLFTAGWNVAEASGGPSGEVELPHDAMAGERRGAAEPSWAHGAYFPGGRYRYRRTWTPGPEVDGRHVSLVVEGVYRCSRVFLDGREIGGSPNGCREFTVRLDPHRADGGAGVEHVIEVDVDNTATPGARWCTGSGIHRPVWLDVRSPTHLVRGETQLTTRLDGSTAHVSVQVGLADDDGVALHVDAQLATARGTVARGRVNTLSTSVTIDLVVPDALLWSAETPVLHDLVLTLSDDDGTECDRGARRVGLRTLALDPRRGLLVNGQAVELRGANTHHDNGVLGAVSRPASERRRVQILRDTGFNAIRSAHNPASRALLQACDELGVYVMDEAFDGWYDHKTENDDADLFDATWRDEVAAMVAKDRLHACVAMYSVGNENGEALTPQGGRVAADMGAELRRLDPTRLATIGVNLVAATFAGLTGAHAKEVGHEPGKAAPDMTSTALNVISNRFGSLMGRLPRSGAADRSTRELFEHFDLAGYTYGSSRYEIDAVTHPDRLVVGTESMPGDLARNAELVRRLPTVIGDFVWAGWDHMGEAGGGAWAHGTRRAPLLEPYPQLTSAMGTIDVTGVPGAAVLLARAAWGIADAPQIAVRPLDVARGPIARSAWRATDAVQSWSWSGHDGADVAVEVHSAGDEVELLVNGRGLGRRAAGSEHGHLARFATRCEPGAIEAVSYRGGTAVGRSRLCSAGPARLGLRVEQALRRGPLELSHVWVELVDDDGTVDSAAQDVVTVQVEGPATLAGSGNGAAATEESFVDAEHSTHRGRALAVVRSTGAPGAVRLSATSTRHGTATAQITGDPVPSGAVPRGATRSTPGHTAGDRRPRGTTPLEEQP